MGAIRLEGVSKSYGGHRVLQDLSLEIGDSEFVAFVGPSGCGKSTLLRIIAGFEAPTAGEVWIDGEPMKGVRPGERGIAMVFQNYALYPHMTAADNLAFGLRNLGTPRAEVERRVREVAESLRITALLARRPAEMSGGQRQRVAIGRAIIQNPRAFVFDEPLSNLDASLRVQMRVEIARLHRRFRAPMVYVTHDQVEAMTLADRIAVMNGGRIEQFGPPLELYDHPASVFVARFLGTPAMNLLPARLVEATAARALVRRADGSVLAVAADARALPPDSEVTLGVRPADLEAMIPASGATAARGEPFGRIRARVSFVERLGGRDLMHLETADGTGLVVDAETKRGPERATDAPLELRVDPRRAHLFDSAGRAVAPVKVRDRGDEEHDYPAHP